MNLLETISQIPGVKSIKPDLKLTEMNIIHVQCYNQYVVSILFSPIESPFSIQLDTKSEAFVQSPEKEVVQIQGKSVMSYNDQDLVRLIKSISSFKFMRN